MRSKLLTFVTLITALFMCSTSAQAGPIFFTVTRGPLEINTGKPYFDDRLIPAIDKEPPIFTPDANHQALTGTLYTLIDPPATPPASLPQIVSSDGIGGQYHQALDTGTFTYHVGINDLESGQSGSWDFTGYIGLNYLQAADGTWSVIENYAVLGYLGPLDLGGNRYDLGIVQLSPQESALLVRADSIPTPEPATAMLFAAGLLPLAGRLRRRLA